MRKTLRILVLLLLTASAWACGTDGLGGNSSHPGGKVFLLSIDGGGIRGIVPAAILTQIEAQTGKRAYQIFDLIGGTSTGGIITIGLTSPNPMPDGKPFTAQELLDIYKTQGGKIFYKQSMFCATCAAYYADDRKGNGVEPYLQSLVSKTVTLADGRKYIQSQPGNQVRQIFTTTYTINSSGGVVKDPRRGWDYGPYLFNTFDATRNPEDNYALWEAARGTSAAPTFFPVAHVGGGKGGRSAAERWVVDGGVMSNDPGVWAVSEALRTGIAKELKDIVLISLGTGLYPADAGLGINNNSGVTVPDSGNWGTAPWLATNMYNLQGVSNRGAIVNVMSYSEQLATDPQLRGFQAAGMQYYRLSPNLPQAQAAMDDISAANIDSLVAITNRYLTGEGKKTFDAAIKAIGN
ncbi:MAG: patatin-like phospholipase family protein [Bacteroidia bacterium]